MCLAMIQSFEEGKAKMPRERTIDRRNRDDQMLLRNSPDGVEYGRGSLFRER
jgi:hypothetical protein